MLFITLAFDSCEKFNLDDEDTKTENKNNENDDSNGNESEQEEPVFGETIDVNTFCNTAIYDQVWVRGYVVGAATGAKGKYTYEFDAPFSFDTALLLADEENVDSCSDVMSVCLTTCSKKTRQALNLVDNPENKGRIIEVFGFQEVYLKIPGMKTLDAYRFPSE